MTPDRKILNKMILRALSGKGAHVAVKDTFAGLDWKLAGVQIEGGCHSIFQILNHIVFWNQWVAKWLLGQKPPTPKHTQGSWPGKAAPENAQQWREALRSLEQGIDQIMRATQEADLLAKQGTKTPLEMLQTIALHSSYHVGQVVVLRQRLGAWPPPSGGLTW